MDNRSPLEAFLPTEPSQTEFFPKLALKDISALARTNRNLNVLFKPALDQHAAKQLLTFVLQGNAEKAKEMYTANPRLLFIEATALEWASGFEKETDDPTHRAVKMSPLSAMLASGDHWMLRETIEILTNYVDEETQQSGHSLVAEQMKRQFPNGFDYPPSTYDFRPLITAIVNDESLIQTGHPSDTTAALIEKFRKDFIPGLVQTGYLFNLNELFEAFELYDRHDESCSKYNTGWDKFQLRFFWRYVIGYLERLVPAVIAQAMSEGIMQVQANMPIQRSMSFMNYEVEKMISYFPLDSDLNCRLGLNFAIDGYIGTYAGSYGSTGNGLAISEFKWRHSEELGRIYESIKATNNQHLSR